MRISVAMVAVRVMIIEELWVPERWPRQMSET